MTASQFYSGYIWAPLVLAVVALGAFTGGWEPRFEPVGFLFGMLAVSGLFGGIPYFLLAAATLLWMKDKDLSQIRRRAKMMPLLFIPVYAAGAISFGLATERSWESGLALAVIGPFYIIPIGYAYVGSGFVLERLLRHLRWIDEQPSPKQQLS